MATWKKILVEGDAVDDNLSTANLTQSGSARLYDINGTTNTLGFKNGRSKFLNSSTEDRFEFNPEDRVFYLYAGSESRYYDDDNSGYVSFKSPSQVTSANSITIEWPSTPPTANQILEVQSVTSGVATTSWITTPSGSGGGVVATYTNGVDNRVITSSGSDSINGEANMTFDGTTLSVTGRIVGTDFITLDTNNKALKGKTTGAAARDLIKCNTSNETEVGNISEKTVLNGTSIDAGTLQFSCGRATIDSIAATNISLTSTGDHGEGSVVTFFDTSASYSTTAGRVYYHTGATTGNRWAFATSTAEAGNKALVGIALGTDQSAGFLLQGFVNPGTTMTAGSQCFIATNASITNTVPTSGFSRVMGHSVTTTVMYFNPSVDYIDL